MKHHTITFMPEGKVVSIHTGATILEAAAQAGIIINAFCGGAGTCNKCQVHIPATGRKVLACNYHITSDMTVVIPETSRYFSERILHHGIDREIDVAPAIEKIFIDEQCTSLDELTEALTRHKQGQIFNVSDEITVDQMSSLVTAVCHRRILQSSIDDYDVIAI